ncbi:MAG: hypothetical protein ACFFD4_34775, partial [Candidatus Odinarchaeota archaeon]
MGMEGSSDTSGFTITTEVVQLWGNFEWTVQLFTERYLEKFRIVLKNTSLDTEITKDVAGLYELASIIRKFAVDHGITIFDRRIASFLHELLSRTGLVDISLEDILDKIKSPPMKETVPVYEVRRKTREKTRSERYRFGDLVPFGGLLRWKVRIGVEKDIYSPIRLEFHDVRERDQQVID